MPHMLLIIEPVGQRATRTEAEGRELYAQMVAFGEGLAARGLLMGSESLRVESTRVQVRDGRAQVVDGPFAEAKELIAGYTLIQVRSREEAMEWSRRFPNPAGKGKPAVIELRQLIELDEFPPSAALDQMKAIDGIAPQP